MFDVRCLGCDRSIGKGVRFNAQKRHISDYLSTKIYEFTMKCHLCSHTFKVRTDPQNCDYLLHEGLKRIRQDAKAAYDTSTHSAFERVESKVLDEDVGKLE